METFLSSHYGTLELARKYNYEEGEQLKGHGDLVFLHDFNVSRASHIMEHYTKAIMVRDPKGRFLASFFALSRKSEYFPRHCCKNIQCGRRGRFFHGFVLELRQCESDLWRPQGQRMERRYFAQLDFVGHFETAQAQNDTKRLLERIGAWDSYGKSGRGRHGDEAIFGATNEELNNAVDTNAYKTNYLRKRDNERLVENAYAWDYFYNYLHLEQTLK